MNGDPEYYSGGVEVFPEEGDEEEVGLPFPPGALPGGQPVGGRPSAGPLPPYLTAPGAGAAPAPAPVDPRMAVIRQLAAEERNINAQQADAAFAASLMQNVRVEDTVKAVELALRFQAMRKFDRDLAAAKAAGLSDEQAAIQAAVHNPGALGGGTQVANFVRGVSPPKAFRVPTERGDLTGVLASGRVVFPPAGAFPPGGADLEVRDYNGQKIVVNRQSGATRLLRDYPFEIQSSLLVNEIKDNQTQLTKLTGLAGFETGKAELRDNIAKSRAALDALLKSRTTRRAVVPPPQYVPETPGGGVPAPPPMIAAPPAAAAPASPPTPVAVPRGTTPPAPLPLPKGAKKEDLVRDQVYQTTRGLLRWNGEKFVTSGR